MPSLFHTNLLYQSNQQVKKPPNFISLNGGAIGVGSGGMTLKDLEDQSSHFHKLNESLYRRIDSRVTGFILTLVAIFIMFLVTMIAIEVITEELYYGEDQSLDETLVLCDPTSDLVDQLCS